MTTPNRPEDVSTERARLIGGELIALHSMEGTPRKVCMNGATAIHALADQLDASRAKCQRLEASESLLKARLVAMTDDRDRIKAALVLEQRGHDATQADLTACGHQRDAATAEVERLKNECSNWWKSMLPIGKALGCLAGCDPTDNEHVYNAAQKLRGDLASAQATLSQQTQRAEAAEKERDAALARAKAAEVDLRLILCTDSLSTIRNLAKTALARAEKAEAALRQINPSPDKGTP